jgi:2-keto-4-pentenoate hydratase/2-oxohepta-3-ene-1,7-dioic acid hydratase in catechol pathway
MEMRFLTAEKGKYIFVGLLLNDLQTVIDLREASRESVSSIELPESLLECLKMGPVFYEEVKRIMGRVGTEKSKKYSYNLNDLILLAPIPKPEKNIFCVGKNYVDHALELGNENDIPKDVMLFSKATTTVVGHGVEILNHNYLTNQLDYEGELAVVIGKQGKRIEKKDALDYVFGYTIINDVTARDLQAKHKQFLLGKSLDSSCPMGPYIVHKTLVENANQLKIETKVNGEIRQKSNTCKFIFDIETIISVISQGTTLEPGDIIATGTPSGVGKGFNPPKFLQPGDIIEISIEGLGTLRNIVEM